jgi:uncharacterized membrane protein
MRSPGGWRRFAIYGAVGWVLEVLMTGACAVVRRRDPRATARTYLWMFPIYGAGGMLMERVSESLRRRPRLARALANVPAIYAVEYASGWLIRRAVGQCPWEYRRGPACVSGLVRLDYAPLWLLVAALFEPARHALFAR